MDYLKTLIKASVLTVAGLLAGGWLLMQSAGLTAFLIVALPIGLIAWAFSAKTH